ncbi:MAG: LysR family transcriptional regulator [Burkholderiales bacterium]
MELRDLRYFAALAHEANLSRAALKLGVSQSTLSKSLSRLESAAGAQLVVRLQRGIELTEQGCIVLQHAERVTAMNADARAALDASQRRPQACLRLGVGLGELEGGLRLVAARFVVHEPAARLDICQAASGELATALSRGDIDCILGPPPEVVPAGHTVTVLGSEVYAGVCRTRHPRAQALSSLASLVQERWVVPWATTRVGQWLGGLAQLRGLSMPDVALRCDSVPTLLSVIANTDCVGYFARSMVEAHPLQSKLSLLLIEEIRYVKTLAFISREHNAELPLVKALRDIAMKELRGGGH